MVKKQDPLKIITFNDLNKIYNFIKGLFYPYIFSRTFPLFQSIDILNNKITQDLPINYLNILRNDVVLLIHKRKLTARLAIAIYKISTLKFRENNTVIGTFFGKKLGIKSKAFKLPYEAHPQTIKIYDLNDTELYK